MSTRVASLYAEVGADTKGAEKGLGQTKTTLTELDKKFREFSAEQTRRAASWEAVEKQKAEATKRAAKEQEEAAQKVAKAEQDAANKRKAAQNQIVKNFRDGAIIITAALIATKKAYDFSKEGAALEFTATKFDRLAKTIGTTGDALSGKLQVATKGTLSEMQAMAVATDILSLGLVKNEKDTIRLAEVQSGLAMDTNQLVLALTNQTTMRFDQLGVSVAGFDDKVKALTKSGMTAQDAFTEAFLQQAEEQLKKVGYAADEDIGSFMRLEAAVADITDTVKKFAGQKLAPDLGAFAWQIKNAKQIAEEYIRIVKSRKGTDFIGQDVQAMAEANVRASNAMGEYYMAQAQAAEGANKLGESLANATKRQIEFGRAGDDVYKGQKDIIGSLDKFVSTISSVSSAQKTYNDGMKEAGDLLKRHKITTKEYNAQVAELRATYDEAAKSIVADLIMMKLTADGTFDTSDMNAYMAALERLGLATEHDVEVTRAMYEAANNAAMGWGNANESIAHTGKLADDVYKPLKTMSDNIYHTGKRAEDAAGGMDDFKDEQSKLAKGINSESAPAVHNLKNAISGLHGKSVNVDVYVKVHGGGIGATSAAVAGAMTQAPLLLPPGQQVVATPTWTGGPINSGGYTIVGDAKGGGWTPYTEVIGPNGYIYNAEDARKLKEMGVLRGASSMFEGSLPGDIQVHSWAVPPPKKRPSGGRSGSPSAGSSGGGGGSSSTASDTAAAQTISSTVAADVGTTVAGLVSAGQQAQTMATAQNNGVLKDILNSIRELTGTVSTNAGVGKAVTETASKYS